MRVAVVAHYPTAGGISRFVVALTTHLVEVAPEMEIGLFVDRQLAERDDFARLFDGIERVEVIPTSDPEITSSTPLASSPPRSRGVLWRAVKRVLAPSKRAKRWAVALLMSFRHRVLGQGKPWYRFAFPCDVVERLNRYDVIYIANPFFLEPVDLKPPVVATIHDLNYKHYPENYNAEMLPLTERQSDIWFSRLALSVSSTEFIRHEVEHYYPVLAGKTRVVFLAPYSYESVTGADFAAVVRSMSLPETYVLYPTNRGAHKNVLGLLQAMAVLKERGQGVPLVISGAGSDLLGDSGATLSPEDTMYSAHRFLRQSGLVVGQDVFPLGYITNLQVDAVTHRAALVVSPSFYEAGCGPGMDAWQFGVSTAISDIPPFVEQMRFLGTEAWLFDPADPRDIARVIHSALSDQSASQAMVERSQQRIHDYTWTDVARQYAALFAEVSAAGADGHPSTRQGDR